MNTMYRALLRPITDPEVWYVAATLGIAESTEVLEIGDSSPFQDITMTMTTFL
jgi:metal-sulfur cluster biosynthetic enzyme